MRSFAPPAAISLFGCLLALVGCELLPLPDPTVPIDPAPSPGPGVVRFTIGEIDNESPALSAATAAQLPAGLAAVRVSIRRASGAGVLTSEPFPLTPSGNGYVSGTVGLAAGHYELTELVVLDEAGSPRFSAPEEGSDDAAAVDDPIPVAFSVLADGAHTVAVEVVEIPAEPPADPDGPFDFTFHVVGPAGGNDSAPIPFTYVRRTIRKPDGSSSVTGSSFIYPPGVQTFTTVYEGYSFDLQVKSAGYRISPVLSFTEDELRLHRDDVPVVTITLEPEVATATLTYTGTDPDNNHVYQARLVSSGFIEDAIAGAGATATDTYSYTVGFKLTVLGPSTNPYAPPGILAYREIAPRDPNGRHAFVPYDSSVIQAMDAYTTLAATLVLDEASRALVEDPVVNLGMEVYVEVLMLTDDGDGAIDNDDAFLGFETETLRLADFQIVVQ